MESTRNAKSGLAAGGTSASIAIISVIYAMVNELSSNITLGEGDVSLNFGIFVPASAAILFGKGIGGAAAGLGALLTSFQDVLAGRETAASLDFNVILNSIANFAGAYVTGFLTQFKKAKPRSIENIWREKRAWSNVLNDTVASVVGMSMTTSYIAAYAGQLSEGSITDFSQGSTNFIATFFASAVVLAISIPLTLFAFDIIEVWLTNRGIRMDVSASEITWDVPDPGDAEVESITLPEGAFKINIWTLIEIKFKNTTGRESAFDIEGVSTSRMYPHLDTSKILQPDETWTQKFYVLPGKQKDVKLRFRLTPKRGKAFKGEILDDVIIEANASVLDPSKNSLGLGIFGGVNFSILGLSVIWEDIVETVQNPDGILGGFGENLTVLGFTAIVEALLFVPIMLILYKIEKSKKELDTFSLAFSEDTESHSYEEKALRKTMTTIIRFQRFLAAFLRFTIIIATLVTIGFLGYEGWKMFDDPNYVPDDPQLIFLVSALVLTLWIVGMRGLDLLGTIGKKRLPPWVLKPGAVILNFKPMAPFQEGIPNEVIVMAQNPTKMSGIRIAFQGFDTVSPQMVELHLSPGEIANFKIAVTPTMKEVRDILAVSYPFFDEENQFISFDEAEPFARQDISYTVQGQTKLGITKDQQRRLFQVGTLAGIIASAVTFMDQLFPDAVDATQFIKESGPYLAVLQAPFIYAWFYYQNKIKGASTSV